MIELINVSKTYANSGNKAVDSATLTIPSGKIFGFLGPNGAGKTTTLKMITGILFPDTGDIKVEGVNIAQDPIAAKSKIGYVTDNPELFSKMKANEYLNFISDVYNIPASVRVERVEHYTKLFEIDEALSSSISSFSHGMKQKLLVTASLLSDPPVWILDEPMIGLDPKSSFNLKAIMRERADAGKTVFFSTHVMDTAEKVCDELAVIHHGKIKFSGTLEDLKNLRGEDSSLETLFLELVDDTSVSEN